MNLQNKNSLSWEFKRIQPLDEQSNRVEKGLSLIMRGYRLKERFRCDTNMTILGKYGRESEYILDKFLSYTAKKVIDGLITGPFAEETCKASKVSQFLWDTFTDCSLKTEYEKRMHILHELNHDVQKYGLQQISVHVVNFSLPDHHSWSHLHVDVEDHGSCDFLICRESIMKIPMCMLN